MPISPIHLSILVDSLVLAGHDGQVAARMAGLTAAQLDPAGPWVDEDCLDRMVLATMAVTGDPGWGFTLSTSLAQSRYGPQAVLIGHAPTLRHALGDIYAFAPLILEAPEIVVEESGATATLHVQPLGVSPEARRFRTEWWMALSVQLSRRAGLRTQDLQEVGFEHAQPPGSAHLDRYQQLFGPDLRFAQGRSWITFPASLLDVPLPGHDRHVYEALRAQVQALMDVRMCDQDPLHATRQAVRLALPRVPEATELARNLGCSERSLRRQLAGRGLSYAELVQQCQREVAERLLREGRLSLKQIADETGFSSASCFHRAFRRWHGQTPTAWREGVR